MTAAWTGISSAQHADIDHTGISGVANPFTLEPRFRVASCQINLGATGWPSTIVLINGLSPWYGVNPHLTFTSAPTTISAGQTISPQVFTDGFESGSLGVSFQLDVYNPAVTERRRVGWNTHYFTATTGSQSWEPTTSGEVNYTNQVLGSDLTVSNGKIVSAAGGIYTATLWVTTDGVPTS